MVSYNTICAVIKTITVLCLIREYGNVLEETRVSKITQNTLRGSRRKGNVGMTSYKLEYRREVYTLETPA